jgi:hypothetical protein
LGILRMFYNPGSLTVMICFNKKYYLKFATLMFNKLGPIFKKREKVEFLSFKLNFSHIWIEIHEI